MLKGRVYRICKNREKKRVQEIFKSAKYKILHLIFIYFKYFCNITVWNELLEIDKKEYSINYAKFYLILIKLAFSFTRNTPKCNSLVQRIFIVIQKNTLHFTSSFALVQEEENSRKLRFHVFFYIHAKKHMKSKC